MSKIRWDRTNLLPTIKHGLSEADELRRGENETKEDWAASGAGVRPASMRARPCS